MNGQRILTALIFIVALIVLYDVFFQSPKKWDAINERIDKIEKEVNEWEDEPELAVYMNYMQLYMNKLWFASEAENFRLANFYLHEIEETAEDIIDGNIMEDGHNISQLTKSMLLPAIDAAEKAVKNEDAVMLKESYNLLVNTCNACHVASDHGFIKIKNPERPVFDNQVYSK